MKKTYLLSILVLSSCLLSCGKLSKEKQEYLLIEKLESEKFSHAENIMITDIPYTFAFTYYNDLDSLANKYVASTSVTNYTSVRNIVYKSYITFNFFDFKNSVLFFSDVTVTENGSTSKATLSYKDIELLDYPSISSINEYTLNNSSWTTSYKIEDGIGTLNYLLAKTMIFSKNYLDSINKNIVLW